MDDERLQLLAKDLYDHIFQVLDAEPSFTGEMAGHVAFQTQCAFEVAMDKILGRSDYDY